MSKIIFQGQEFGEGFSTHDVDLLEKVGEETLITEAQTCSGAINELKSNLTHKIDNQTIYNRALITNTTVSNGGVVLKIEHIPKGKYLIMAMSRDTYVWMTATDILPSVGTVSGGAIMDILNLTNNDTTLSLINANGTSKTYSYVTLIAIKLEDIS